MRLLDTDHWSEVFQTIARNKKRSVFTALGVFWGIFMLTILLGAGNGLEMLYRNQLGTLTINTLMLNPERTSIPYRGMPSGRWWSIYNEDIVAVTRLDEVEHASGIFWGSMVDCSNGRYKGNYQLMGYSSEYQKINPRKIIAGRFLNPVDIEQRRKVCVIGKQVSNELFPDDPSPIGKTIHLQGTYLTVVGVSEAIGNLINFEDVAQSIAAPITLVQQIYSHNGVSNGVHMLAVAGKQGVPMEVLENKVKELIFIRHIISPDDQKAVWTMNIRELTEKVNGLFDGIALLTWIVGLGTLLAGIIGVSNIMLVLVKERTQEIGVRRAIGAPPGAIITQILSESFVLTSIAGLLALTAAVGLLSLTDKVMQQFIPDTASSFQISFPTGMLAAGIIVAGSLLAGIIPTIRALNIKAVDAIREE